MASAFWGDDEQEASYYAVLNLPRDASTEEITRSYRKLAQVFHPDKHTDEQMRKHAQESFSKLQEAYEVLSDSRKRQIYDVYGKQGLVAGLEVGDNLKSRDELKREWEEFQKRQEKQRQEQSVAQKGSYQFKLDASRMLKGLPPQGNLFRQVVAQSSFDAMVGERNVTSLQGQAVMKTVRVRMPDGRTGEATMGGGNVVAGYRRSISQDDTIEISGQLGLQNLITITSTRRLDRQTGLDGWMNMTYSPESGVGMQVGCSQALFHNMQGNTSVVVGPKGMTGVSTSITKKGSKYTVTGKVEVGAVTAVSCRASYAVNDSVTLRLIGRLGTQGIDLELGAQKRWSPQAIGYMGTVWGYPAGVQLKLRFTRAQQTFECPILLSTQFDDWQVLAAAYVLPPLLFWGTTRFVVKPIMTWAKRSHERSQQAEKAGAVEEALKAAATEQKLLEPVALRKAQTEADRNGLVILEAAYGVLEHYREAARSGTSSASAATASTDAAAGEQPSSSQQQGQGEQQQAAEDSSRAADEASASGSDGDGSATASTSGSSEQQQQQRGWWSSRGKRGASDLPPQWLNVTMALQYLVVDSKLVLHPGVSKAGLMGFTDPAPHSSEKELYVAYLFQGMVYECTVSDTDALQLPGVGDAVKDAVRELMLKTKAPISAGTR